MKKLLRLFIFLFSIPNGIHAQKIDSVNLLLPTAKKIKMKTFTFPAVFLTYGLISIENDELKSLNLSTKNELKEHFPFFKSNLDNYTQFLPAITVFSLNAMGIKGEHDLKDAALIYAGTIAVNTAVVFPMKQLVHELRPDNSGYTSFPSG
ncbi:MAG: PAP2 family protein, partial [Sphingobacteriales bacterium]